MESINHHSKIESKAASYANIESCNNTFGNVKASSIKCSSLRTSPAPQSTSAYRTTDEQLTADLFIESACANDNINHVINTNTDDTIHSQGDEAVCSNSENNKQTLISNNNNNNNNNNNDDDNDNSLAKEELDMFDIELQREFQSEVLLSNTHVCDVNGQEIHIPRLRFGVDNDVHVYSGPPASENYIVGDSSNYQSNDLYQYDNIKYNNNVGSLEKLAHGKVAKSVDHLVNTSSCMEYTAPFIDNTTHNWTSERRINGLQNGSLSPGVPTPPLTSPCQFVNSQNNFINVNDNLNNTCTGRRSNEFFGVNTTMLEHANNDNYRNSECGTSYSPPFVGCMSHVGQLIQSKQFPSLANTCQMSSITTNREETLRVVHHLANELRRELHVPKFTNNSSSSRSHSRNVSESVPANHIPQSRSNSTSTSKRQTSPLAVNIATLTTTESKPTNVNNTSTNANNWTDKLEATQNVVAAEEVNTTSNIFPNISPRTVNLESDITLLMRFLQEVAHNHTTMLKTPSSPYLSHSAQGNLNHNCTNQVTCTNTIANANTASRNRIDNHVSALQTENITERAHGKGHYNNNNMHVNCPVSHTRSFSPSSTHVAHKSPLSLSSPRLVGATQNTRTIITGAGINNGRSTIDTEVCDSLNRLNVASVTNVHKQTQDNVMAGVTNIAYEHEMYRPVNPYQGISHGAYTTPQQLPQTQYPAEFVHWCKSSSVNNINNDLYTGNYHCPSPCITYNEKTKGKEIALLHNNNNINNSNSNNNNNNNGKVISNTVSMASNVASHHTSSSVIGTVNNNCNKASHHTSHPPPQIINNGNNNSTNIITNINTTSLSVSRKANRTSNNNNANNSVVAHPRAVKPGVSKGKSRGPRSQSGKNVSPSNHSVFSECSGGETRSYESTNTILRHNTSLSLNATTNTSLSSTTTYPVREMNNNNRNNVMLFNKDIINNSSNNSSSNSDNVIIDNNNLINSSTIAKNVNIVVSNNSGVGGSKASRTRAAISSINNTGMPIIGNVNSLM